jgi:glycosyltransferase involved in cell wall biosynthesis
MQALPRISFCIITSGHRRALLEAVIASIQRQRTTCAEILIAGRHRDAPGITYLPAERAADEGRLGHLRNLAVARAQYEYVAVLDDDIVLAPDWVRALFAAPDDFDVLTSQVRLPDGGRYWDHATFGGPRGHAILEAHEHDAHVYMTGGGGWVMRREVFEVARWDGARTFYAGEDVDLAARLRGAGMRLRHWHGCVVYHVDPQYTTIGRTVHRRRAGRSASWVETLSALSPVELAREVEQLYQAGRLAEMADALRFACRAHPAVTPLRRALDALEDAHGGRLSDARWCAGTDPDLLAALYACGASADVALLRTPAVRTIAPRTPMRGVNLFGFLSGNLGLGVAARAYLRLLVESGVPVHAVDVDVGEARRLRGEIFPVPIASLRDPTPHDVNLFIMTPDDAWCLMEKGSEILRVASRTNACVPFWELPRIPPFWHQTLRTMDLVAAPSQFVRYAMLAEVSQPTIAYWPLPVYVPDDIEPDRERFGLAPDVPVFVVAFEMASDINRKNPMGAIAAFLRAFPVGTRAQLVIKVNHGAASPTHMSALCELAASDPRVRILEQALSYRDVLALYASADALISLHRAEGFGLCIAEAMAVGRPVVATGWSGNLDFATERNACLVGYTLEPVRAANQAAYQERYTGPGVMWAEPDIDAAATWLVRLAGDPALRETIGQCAKADMAARQAALSPDALLAALERASSRARRSRVPTALPAA